MKSLEIPKQVIEAKERTLVIWYTLKSKKDPIRLDIVRKRFSPKEWFALSRYGTR